MGCLIAYWSSDGQEDSPDYEGEAVVPSSRHSDDTLATKGLDLLRQQLVLPVAVAPPAIASMAPGKDSSVGGEG